MCNFIEGAGTLRRLGVDVNGFSEKVHDSSYKLSAAASASNSLKISGC
jgi:hypothetical protein